MTRSHKLVGFVTVVLFGVYGCAKGPGDATEKNTSPTAKVQRLEEDLRATSAARDQFRQKLLAAEEQQKQLQKQLDADRAKLKSRTSERDTIATQYEGFRKNLKDLINQAEGTLGTPSLATPPQVGTNLAPTPSETGVGQRN